MTGNSTTAFPAPWPLPSSYTPTQEVNKQVGNRVCKEQQKKILNFPRAVLSQIHCLADQHWNFQNSMNIAALDLYLVWKIKELGIFKNFYIILYSIFIPYPFL